MKIQQAIDYLGCVLSTKHYNILKPLKRIATLLLPLAIVISCNTPSKTTSEKDFTILFEKSGGTETDTYENVIQFYQDLASEYPQISLFEIGETDSGYPLHLVVFNPEGSTNLDDIRASSKNRILINNGIHPGESDGIDASMMLFRNLVQNDSLQKHYKNSLICTIPVYNIGGALNRNSHTRANQNGPKAYGFRGNSRNFDLNRDFIKLDTKNAKTFSKLFHLINPDVFIDNHVSNGADYQYAITHLFTQHNKLGGELGVLLEQEMRPALEKSLNEKGIIITPYVNVWGSTPEKGFSQFYDSPRYSTGYTTLFNTLGLMVETHMLKPYDIRVKQTYELMLSVFDFTEATSKKIKQLRTNAKQEVLSKKTYPIAFSPNKENPSTYVFKGYEGEVIKSKVTTGDRLFYDRSKPYEKPISYYNNFIPTKEVTIPKAYIVPSGWTNVLDKLQINHIEYSQFEKDTILTVEVAHIADYQTRKNAYEGHYLHYNTSVTKSTQNIFFKKGTIYISTDQDGVRYLLETLEAEATDSFFNWNFFDTILQQKEGFSGYVFEDIAENFLEQNPSIKQTLAEKVQSDTSFANNPYAQLYWVYQQTPHYEKAHMRLPIFKVF